MEATLTSLTTTLPLYPNIIYKQLILIAVYHTNLPITVPNLYLVLALYLVSTTYKNKALTLYKNFALITSKRKVLELSCSLKRLCLRILLNALDVINSNS